MPTALITGASSGIGYELAKRFARDGYRLVLVARHREKLSKVSGELAAKYGVEIKIFTKDLSASNTPEEIFAALNAEGWAVDLLVNNAGFGLLGRFAGTSLADELQMIQVNCTALVHLTKLFLPGMIARKNGRILNVASTAAFQPGPLMAVYYATKAFVLSFSEALAEELQGSGVTVTALCPGRTRTEFQARAGSTRTAFVRELSAMDAPAVAEAGYRGLMRGRRIVIPGILNRLIVQSLRLAPRILPPKIARKLQKT